MKSILLYLITFACIGLLGSCSTPSEKDLKATTIELNIGEESAFALLMYEDGTINRRGNGEFPLDKNFFMGVQKDSLLKKLGKTITDDLLDHFDRSYDYKIKEGQICQLEMTIFLADKRYAVRYIYGSESEGPPKEVMDYVWNAIRITDPWHQKQIEMISENDE